MNEQQEEDEEEDDVDDQHTHTNSNSNVPIPQQMQSSNQSIDQRKKADVAMMMQNHQEYSEDEKYSDHEHTPSHSDDRHKHQHTESDDRSPKNQNQITNNQETAQGTGMKTQKSSAFLHKQTTSVNPSNIQSNKSLGKTSSNAQLLGVQSKAILPTGVEN